MGVKHGAWCVGCCWALMASLFALGVMSLVWMAVVAALIAAEKLIPWRRVADLRDGGDPAGRSVCCWSRRQTPFPGLTIPGNGSMPGMTPMGMSHDGSGMAPAPTPMGTSHMGP